MAWMSQFSGNASALKNGHFNNSQDGVMLGRVSNALELHNYPHHQKKKKKILFINQLKCKKEKKGKEIKIMFGNTLLVSLEDGIWN